MGDPLVGFEFVVFCRGRERDSSMVTPEAQEKRPYPRKGRDMRQISALEHCAAVSRGPCLSRASLDRNTGMIWSPPLPIWSRMAGKSRSRPKSRKASSLIWHAGRRSRPIFHRRQRSRLSALMALPQGAAGTCWIGAGDFPAGVTSSRVWVRKKPNVSGNAVTGCKRFFWRKMRRRFGIAASDASRQEPALPASRKPRAVLPQVVATVVQSRFHSGEE
jgi:hypothetical protein